MKGVVKVLKSTFSRKGKSLDTLLDALKAEADCGCGIDCCKNMLVLTDQTDGKKYGLVIDGGVLKIGEVGGTKSPV